MSSRMHRFFQISVMLLALFVMAFPATAATQMDDLENALMCTCDDKCGKVLINCTCDHSKMMRKKLKKQLDSGLTVKQIVQTYIDKHGETVLSAPSKTGFNLSAWVTPFIALVVGGVGVRKVIRTWVRPSGATANAPESPSPTETSEENEASPKSSSRLKRELDSLED